MTASMLVAPARPASTASVFCPCPGDSFLLVLPDALHVRRCPVPKLIVAVTDVPWSAELSPGQPTLEGYSAGSN